MSSVSITRSAQLGCDLLGTVGEVKSSESTLKHGKRCLRLVEGDFVACLVDAEEADCDFWLVSAPPGPYVAL